MSIQLTPSILSMDNKFLDVYERTTRASESKIEELGLSDENPIYTSLRPAGIPEFIVLQAENLVADSTKTWDLSRVNQTLVLKSLYIDSPTADNFNFKILVDNVPIFKFFVPKDRTPLSFPAAPLPPNVKIQITTNSLIDFIRIVLQPAVILTTLIPDEDLPPVS